MSQPCPYCGKNPVPHLLYWYEESLNILLTPLRLKLVYNPLTRFFKTKLLSPFSEQLFGLAKILGLLRLQNDPAKCKVRRAQVLWEEASKRGIQMSEVLLFGRPIDIYTAIKNPSPLIHNPLPQTEVPPMTAPPPAENTQDEKLRIIFSGLPRPKGESGRWLELMDDKFLLKQKFLQANLPVPQGSAAASASVALKIFNQIDKPVIVKPRAGSRGRHTTTFIYTEADLRQAYRIAKQLCYWVIVEEQLEGPVFRATVINGQLAGVLRGDPPQVLGDGIKNIAQLIGAKNAHTHPGVKDIVPDPSMELFLSRQNLQLSSVPTVGQAVSLSEKVGVNYGGSSSEDFDICHPDNKELFLKAAKAVGDPIVGFDFIIPDISRTFRDQKCGFIEANSLPFINLHHDPQSGIARNPSAMVWEMMGW